MVGSKPYEPMIDVGQASEMMGISRQSVHALVRSGQLNAITFSGAGGSPIYRFRPSEVEKAIRRTKNQGRVNTVFSMDEWEPPPPRPPLGMSRRGRPRIVFDLDRAEALRRSGLGFVEIAREVGVSSTTVANALRTGQREILRGPGRPSLQFDVQKAIDLRREGKNFSEIALEIGVSAPTISKVVREAAPELLRPSGFRDNDAVARMVAMRRGGATYKEIGAAFGMHGQTIANGFKSMGIRSPSIHRGVPRARFDVARAVEMRRSGKSYKQIGQEFGLCNSTVARAIKENSGLKGSTFNFDIKKAMEMRRKGYGFVAISKAVGASRPTVTNAIKIKMLSAPIRQFQPGFDITRAKDMRRARMSYRAIAEALGSNAQTVATHLKNRGMDVNMKYGPRFDLKLARRLRRQGMSFAEIARTCEVSIATISRYLSPRHKPESEPAPPSGSDASSTGGYTPQAG